MARIHLGWKLIEIVSANRALCRAFEIGDGSVRIFLVTEPCSIDQSGHLQSLFFKDRMVSPGIQ